MQSAISGARWWHFKEKHLAHALTFYSLSCSTTMKPQSMQIAVELQIWHGDALKEQLNFKLRLVPNTHLRASGALSRPSQPLLCHGFSTRTCIGEAARTVILCMCVVNLLLSRVMHKILEPPTFGFLFSEVTFMARFGWCLHNSVLCHAAAAAFISYMALEVMAATDAWKLWIGQRSTWLHGAVKNREKTH